MAVTKGDTGNAPEGAAADGNTRYVPTYQDVSIKHAVLSKMRSKLRRRRMPAPTSFPLVDTQRLVLLRDPQNPYEFDHRSAYGQTVFHWSDAIPFIQENTNKTITSVSMHNITRDHDREIQRFRDQRKRGFSLFKRPDDEVMQTLDYDPMCLSDIRSMNHEIARILRPEIPYAVTGAAALVVQGYTRELKPRQIEILCRPEHADWIWSEAKKGGGLVCDSRRDVFGVSVSRIDARARAVHIIPVPEGFDNLLNMCQTTAPVDALDNPPFLRCLSLTAMADLVADKFICAFKLPVFDAQPLRAEMDWILDQSRIHAENNPWTDAHLPHINHDDFLVPFKKLFPESFALLAKAGCVRAMNKMGLNDDKIEVEADQSRGSQMETQKANEESHGKVSTQTFSDILEETEEEENENRDRTARRMKARLRKCVLFLRGKDP